MFCVTQTYKNMTSVVNGIAVSPPQEVEGECVTYVNTIEEAKKIAYGWLQNMATIKVEIEEYEHTKKWEIELDVLKMKEIT